MVLNQRSYLAAGVEGSSPSHEEVADVARTAGPLLARWLEAILAGMEPPA